jgi:hypothetical protein
VKRNTPGRLISVNGNYTLLMFNEGAANQFRAWIQSQYITAFGGGSSTVSGAEYVVIWETYGYDEYSRARGQKIPRFTSGYLAGSDGDSSLLVFNRGQNNEYRVWVNNLYVAPVIN